MPSTLSNAEFLKIRKNSFHSLPSDMKDIEDIAGAVRHYQTIANKSCGIIYYYLTRYVREISTAWHDKPFSDISILDWGTGWGQNALSLKSLGGNISACDVPVPVADEHRGDFFTRHGIPFKMLEHEYLLPFEEGSFDVVLSFGVLEHVPDDKNSLSELHRVLRPGGLFICLFLPYSLSWTQHLFGLLGKEVHDRLYSRAQVRGLLAGAGFSLHDMWFRQLFPKNKVHYPAPNIWERIDQCLVDHTPLKYLSTNLEFISSKNR
ncbi:MAG: class I SAM-dependent methyltransferase [Deltaproteobacteria bacterium]|nr:class I SAM-dependent methyltransferase [Deltaproteobacteria bacterium]